MKNVRWVFTWVALLAGGVACGGEDFRGYTLTERGVLYVMDSDGGNQRILRDDQSVSTPSWRPDGLAMVYDFSLAKSMNMNDVMPDIFVMDLLTGTHGRVGGGEFDEHLDMDPVYSPDGLWIAYSSSRGNNGDIFLVRSDGSEEVRLTQGKERESSPTWHPGGEIIAYDSSLSGEPESNDWDIYSIRVADPEAKPEPRVMSEGRDFTPAWSHDGRRLAFASDRDGDLEIYVLDVVGEDPLRQLTDNEGVHDLFPSWSPNDDRICFHSNMDGDYDIYVMDVEDSGEGPRKLTHNPATDFWPSWSSRDEIAYVQLVEVPVEF